MIRWFRFPLFFSFRDADALVQARRIGEREGEDRGIAIGRLMAINDLRDVLNEHEKRIRHNRISLKAESD